MHKIREALPGQKRGAELARTASWAHAGTIAKVMAAQFPGLTYTAEHENGETVLVYRDGERLEPVETTYGVCASAGRHLAHMEHNSDECNRINGGVEYQFSI